MALTQTGSRPSQGEYRAAPDAPSLIAGDPVLRADATGATPLRDENGTLYYRVNGGSMDGQIIYVQPTTPTPQTEQPATTLERGSTADRSGDIALGFAPLTMGPTASSRLGAQVASEVLAAEMEFGPPQLRLAGAATLTGVALWAAGRQNTEYEALSPEERDRLRQPLINVPPPPLPPLPGLVPPPIPDNSILPGTPTQPNNLPPLEGFQIAPPRTIDDLIIESRRLGENTPGTLSGPETRISPNEDAATTRSLIRENETAEQLAAAGYDVERNPTVPGAKEPDYLVNGETADCYAPSTANVRNIWDRVEDKINNGQTERVVINLVDSRANVQDVVRQFSDFPMPGLRQLFIFDQDGNLTVLNWTKGK